MSISPSFLSFCRIEAKFMISSERETYKLQNSYFMIVNSIKSNDTTTPIAIASAFAIWKEREHAASDPSKPMVSASRTINQAIKCEANLAKGPIMNDVGSEYMNVSYGTPPTDEDYVNCGGFGKSPPKEMEPHMEDPEKGLKFAELIFDPPEVRAAKRLQRKEKTPTPDVATEYEYVDFTRTDWLSDTPAARNVREVAPEWVKAAPSVLEAALKYHTDWVKHDEEEADGEESVKQTQKESVKQTQKESVANKAEDDKIVINFHTLKDVNGVIDLDGLVEYVNSVDSRKSLSTTEGIKQEMGRLAQASKALERLIAGVSEDREETLSNLTVAKCACEAAIEHLNKMWTSKLNSVEAERLIIHTKMGSLEAELETIGIAVLKKTRQRKQDILQELNRLRSELGHLTA